MRSPIPEAVIPTSGILSFGYQRSATHVHQGIDLPAPLGTLVRSVTGGTVVRTGRSLTSGFSGYGRFVVVQAAEAGPWLLYAHLDEVSVEPGQNVRKGQNLGTVGRTCFDRDDPTRLCSGTHLHFEVSPRSYPQDSEAPRLDPVAWLSGGGALLLLAALGAASWALWRQSRGLPIFGDLLPGGNAEGRSPSEFDAKQLRVGTKHEMEHTNDWHIAREIAMDHLAEDPNYYRKLIKAGL